ncbi:MAG: type I restriction-modification enzyme R subunit C-terminal domain-containing protein, partial [Bacteroidota bacterium]
AIFEYFDALLIGLTATPKKDIDRNTYGLFGIEDDNPTFAYQLDEAVENGYLVPYKAHSVPLKFQREGIRYAELSDREQEEYEEKFGDPTQEVAPDEIGSAALNKWLFNHDTVDKVLEYLMEEGIRVEGGDKIGKTIIFAKNHKHAKFIEERFEKNYPEYGGAFLAVIDNYNSKAQDLLEKFCDPLEEQEPQIAVSVDMMDTGVDAPRVVNLVFFKLVRSAAKFWQMIGRGTRLCPDLFGPGDHKREFFIFDYCENFEYFDVNPEGAKTGTVKSLRQQIFEAKLEVAHLINQRLEKSEEEQEIRDQYLSELHGIVANLDEKRFVVRKQLRYVEAYRDKAKWLNLSEADIARIKQHLSHLEEFDKHDHEKSRRFDMLVLMLQIYFLASDSKASKYQQKIYVIAQALQKKDTIPEVMAQISLIKEIQTERYWETIGVKKLEKLRVAIRELLIYLVNEAQESVYTHFEDDLDRAGVVVREPRLSYGNFQTYKERVETYVRDNKHNLAIDKLFRNIPITSRELEELESILFTEDVAGTREQFVKEYGEQPLGAFVRSIIGLDAKSVKEAFADFLQVGHLRADQMTFIQTIMSYLTKNGTIDKSLLYESPFTDLHDQGISGVFEDDAELIRLVKIIDQFNQNAMLA